MTLTLMRLGAVIVAVAVLAGETRNAGMARAPMAQPAVTVLPDVPLLAVGSAADVPARPLPAQGRWFLAQVQGNCAPCDALLLRIQTDAPAIAPRLVIVVSGSAPADVNRMMTAFAGLGPAAWFADQPGALSAALHIGEMPIVLAMNDRSIQWTLAGGLSHTQRLRDVLTGWVTVPGE